MHSEMRIKMSAFVFIYAKNVKYDICPNMVIFGHVTLGPKVKVTQRSYGQFVRLGFVCHYM